MDFENYKEGQSMQRPPLFEANGFIYWKNRFETYVKSKDIDLWFIIIDGDNLVTNTKDEDQKKLVAKNNEAKMMLYNALPKKEYERVFMCKTAKEVWQSLIVTHQGNSQVKDNKIDLLISNNFLFPKMRLLIVHLLGLTLLLLHLKHLMNLFVARILSGNSLEHSIRSGEQK